MMTVAAAAQAQFATPLVQQIDADERDDHVNVSVLFTCTMRYVANNPTSHGSGTTITLRLGPDCGPGHDSGPPELPVVGGTSTLVNQARLESAGLGTVTLTLGWQRELDFVMAPTSDGRGLRLRLLRVTPGPKTHVSVGEVSEAPEGYAINLDSSREKFDPAAVQAAAVALQAPAYVSVRDLDGVQWYRLRVGPFTARKEAERVLRAARATYPRAWLAINDETATDVSAVPAAGLPAVAVASGSDPALPDAERVRLLAAARGAMRHRQFPQAIELLAKLLRQPEYPDRAAVQELAGLARERSGQLAYAKLEYQEYLRRYPDGPAAARIRYRLRVLASAGRPGQSTVLFGGGERELGWSLTGTASQLYENGRDRVQVADTVTSGTSLNVLLTDFDLLARRRGERFDFNGRVSGGYTHDMIGASTGDKTRVNAAYAEFDDREFGWGARVGRQSHTGDGILGLFDGAFVSWQWRPKIGFNGGVGFPADTSSTSVSTDRRFISAAAEFGPYREAWIFGTFVVEQQILGNTDRRGVGLETRYFVPGRTAVLLVDYDLAFQELNSVILMGNWQLPAHWTLAFDLDHRRSPVLMLRNAIIGQAVTSLSGLEVLYSPAEIEQLALDRTPLTDTLALSLSRPLGERWQFMADAFALRVGATPASGGVIATPSTGLDRSLQVQFSGSSLLRASDLHFFGARVQQSPQQRSAMLMWNARFPLVGAWRVGPRLRVERRENDMTQSTQTLYLPEFRLDWTSPRSIFEINAGGEIGRQQLPADTQNTRRLYFLLGYRLRF